MCCSNIALHRIPAVRFKSRGDETEMADVSARMPTTSFGFGQGSQRDRGF